MIGFISYGPRHSLLHVVMVLCTKHYYVTMCLNELFWGGHTVSYMIPDHVTRTLFIIHNNWY